METCKFSNDQKIPGAIIGTSYEDQSGLSKWWGLCDV